MYLMHLLMKVYSQHLSLSNNKKLLLTSPVFIAVRQPLVVSIVSITMKAIFGQSQQVRSLCFSTRELFITLTYIVYVSKQYFLHLIILNSYFYLNCLEITIKMCLIQRLEYFAILCFTERLDHWSGTISHATKQHNRSFMHVQRSRLVSAGVNK